MRNWANELRYEERFERHLEVISKAAEEQREFVRTLPKWQQKLVEREDKIARVLCEISC